MGCQEQKEVRHPANKNATDLVSDLKRLTNRIPAINSAAELAIDTVEYICRVDQPALI